MHALTAKTLITASEEIADPIVIIEDGMVVEVSTGAARELPADHTAFGDAVLAPGYIDIHIHGAAGFDVMRASPSELAHFERFLARHGVTAYLPTTMTAPEQAILHALEGLSGAIRRPHQEPGRAHAIGIHLEGPFISHAKRGVHPPDWLRPADTQLFDRFHDAAQGTMRLMTFAPELPDAGGFISHATAMGVTVSLGHSDADFAQTRSAIRAGARSATHTFNAMRPLDHREPGIVGAVLSDDRLFADIIADGVHVHPDIVRLFLKAKGDDRAVLISDAVSATGMPDGHYQLGPLEVQVKGDRCEYEGRLAGSVLTLDRAVRNVMQFDTRSLARAVRLATYNPAQLLKLTNRGHIAPGHRADFVVLTPQGHVKHTVIAGALSSNP